MNGKSRTESGKEREGESEWNGTAKCRRNKIFSQMTGISGRLGAFYCCWSCCCCRSSVVLLCFYQCTLFNFSVCLCCRFTGHSFSLSLTQTYTHFLFIANTPNSQIFEVIYAVRVIHSSFYFLRVFLFLRADCLSPKMVLRIKVLFRDFPRGALILNHTLTLAHPIHSHVGFHSFNWLAMQKPEGKEGDRMEKSHITTKYRYGVDLNWIQVPILTASVFDSIIL